MNNFHTVSNGELFPNFGSLLLMWVIMELCKEFLDTTAYVAVFIEPHQQKYVP